MRRLMLTAIAAVAAAAIPVASAGAAGKIPPPYCNGSHCPEDRYLAYIDCVLAETLTFGKPGSCRLT